MVIGDIIDALKKDMLCPQSSFACFSTWLKLGWGGGGVGDGGKGAEPMPHRSKQTVQLSRSCWDSPNFAWKY